MPYFFPLPVVYEGQGKEMPLLEKAKTQPLPEEPPGNQPMAFPRSTRYFSLRDIVHSEISLWHHRVQILSFPFERNEGKERSNHVFHARTEPSSVSGVLARHMTARSLAGRGLAARSSCGSTRKTLRPLWPQTLWGRHKTWRSKESLISSGGHKTNRTAPCNRLGEISLSAVDVAVKNVKLRI
jgi:hypothetical protein